MSQLIVTHHAPDLDAIGAIWLLKCFDSQHYADAKISFVDPGDKITLEKAEEVACQLHEVKHVDTGYGEFDHHQLKQAKQRVSASSLVYDYLLRIHPELKDDKALKEIVDFITDIDHFGETEWPDAHSNRYCFMIHELIRGHETVALHDDDSQVHFGMQCLGYAYAALKQTIKAREVIAAKASYFDLKFGKCLAVETRNNDVTKQAQKQGFAMVVTKDPKRGNINIKVRPDIAITLKKLHEEIKEIDHKGTWYYHHNGKMLINGSRKHRNQIASPLNLQQLITLIKSVYE